MATDKPRYTVTVDNDTLAKIERFRYINKYSTRSKATAALIKLGLEYSEKQNFNKNKEPDNK